MSNLERLKKSISKPDLAELLRIDPRALTYVLYKTSDYEKYKSFDIPKRSGGHRKINAPINDLKVIQARLSEYLLGCIDEINVSRSVGEDKFCSTLSHGFVRKKSIITNAEMHRNCKNLLNIDLENYFDSFNFGRVRGFFIKNRNFLLHEDIATLIAKIACYQNKLPQGSPCSPVITNLITHALDIRLAKYARRYSCIYTRYADDISISTRKELFPSEIASFDGVEYFFNKKFKREIERAGFSINLKKTRLQYLDSRQVVTGLVVNRRVSVPSEYWREVRSQCYQLFKKNEFYEIIDGQMINGDIQVLEGKLNYIDSVDKYNRKLKKPPLDIRYKHNEFKKETYKLFNSREKVFSQFLFYKWFFINDVPVVLTEGPTDIVYLKEAIKSLAKKYVDLVDFDEESLKIKMKFLKYTNRTQFLLGLSGGSDFLKDFVRRYPDYYDRYSKGINNNPVIVLLDNDDGFKNFMSQSNNNEKKKAKKNKNKEAYFELTEIGKKIVRKGCNDKHLKSRLSEFTHLGLNLYVVLTPLKDMKEKEDIKDYYTAIEDLFHDDTLQEKLGEKSFSRESDFDVNRYYGKKTFAEYVVQAKSNSIDFTGFEPLLDRIVKVMEHHKRLDN